MDVMRYVFSDAIVLLTVGSAVISGLLAAACFIAGCSSHPETARTTEPAESADAVDYTWMRAA